MRVIVTGLSASGKSSLCEKIALEEDRTEPINIGDCLIEALGWTRPRDELGNRTSDQVLKDYEALHSYMKKKGFYDETTHNIFLFDTHLLLPYRNLKKEKQDYLTLSANRINWLYAPDLIIVNTRRPGDIYQTRLTGRRDRAVTSRGIIKKNQERLVRAGLNYGDHYPYQRIIDERPVPVMVLPGHLPNRVGPAITMIRRMALELDYIKNYQDLRKKPTPVGEVTPATVPEIG